MLSSISNAENITKIQNILIQTERRQQECEIFKGKKGQNKTYGEKKWSKTHVENILYDLIKQPE